MNLGKKLSLLIFILAAGWIIGLYLFPNMTNIIIASGTMTMAVGTFFMAYITFISYRKLIEIQRKSLEPALSVDLWRIHLLGQKSTEGFGVTIKNDGHGIAKNVQLRINWALFKKPSSGEWVSSKFADEDFYVECMISIGNISSKDKLEISKIPLPKIDDNKEAYGIRLSALCEDVFGNNMIEYSDTKNIYLSDAEVKKIEI
jgi:hypothetical protein